MSITYGDHLTDIGYHDITPEQEREIEAREECERRGIDPDEICADGGVTAWMVMDKAMQESASNSAADTSEYIDLIKRLRAGVPVAEITETGSELYDIDSAETTMAEAADWLVGQRRFAKRQKSQARLREKKKGAICPACNGAGTDADYVGDDMRPVEAACHRCNGTGRVPAAQIKAEDNPYFKSGFR